MTWASVPHPNGSARLMWSSQVRSALAHARQARVVDRDPVATAKLLSLAAALRRGFADFLEQQS